MKKTIKAVLKAHLKEYRQSIIDSYCIPATSGKAKDVYSHWAKAEIKKLNTLLRAVK